MPAYAKDGKVVCYFQSAEKFKSRYATFGFSDEAIPRRRRYVADLLRADGIDSHQRGKDQRAREESGELKTEPFADPTTRPQPNTRSGSYFSFTRRTRSRLPPQ
jgi:hypothetical protein